MTLIKKTTIHSRSGDGMAFLNQLFGIIDPFIQNIGMGGYFVLGIELSKQAIFASTDSLQSFVK